MSGEGKKSMPPFPGGRASVLHRKYASQPASPRGKPTGRLARNALGRSVTPDPHLRYDGFQKAASASGQQHEINQPFRADSPRPRGLSACAENPMGNSVESLSTPKSLFSVRSMPVAPVEQDRLDRYSLGGYISSPCASYTAPQKTGHLSLPRSPPIVVAGPDPIPSSRQFVLRTPIPSQKESSLVVPESSANSHPTLLMKGYCASSNDECASGSVSSKSIGSDGVTILGFVGASELEDKKSTEVTKYHETDPRSITEEEIGLDEALMASCGHLPRVPPSLEPLDLRLSLNTSFGKDTAGDPDPSFHRAVGSPEGPVKEAFVEQVGSAFCITNLKNDSLGRLPQIIALEQSSSEHEPPELIVTRKSSPEGYRSRKSETLSSNSSNETIHSGARNVAILPGESDHRYRGNCYRESHGEMDIGSAASVKLQGEGSILPDAAWVRAASEEFLREEKGNVELKRRPFPPGQGGGSSQGIHPAPPIKTTVLCYTNVLPEKPRASTPVLPIGDSDISRPDSPSDSLGFSSARWSRVSVASSMLHASGCAGGSECSKSLGSIKALLLNERIQLKDDDAGSRNGVPRDRLSCEARSRGTAQY